MNPHPTARRVLFHPRHESPEVSTDATQPEATSQRIGFWWGAGSDADSNKRELDWRSFGSGGNSGPFGMQSGGNSGPFGFGSGGNSGPFGAYRRSVGLGYHPDLPDMRDYCLRQSPRNWDARLKSAISDIVSDIKYANARMELRLQGTKRISKTLLNKTARVYDSYLLRESNTQALPKSHDLRMTGHFTPVEDQGQIGSCTAQAVIGLVEYLMRSGGDPEPEMSRLFLYKVSRRLLGWSGDTGSYLRTAIKAMVLFGVPPESEWPYIEGEYETEPEAYHFAFAQSFKASVYARFDGYGSNSTGSETLEAVKRSLLDGFPVVFGFPVYSSIDHTGPNNGFVIPIPSAVDRNEGGHAVLAVGYDDTVDCGTGLDGKPSNGALIIRNSWSSEWAMNGYAYLPYEYVAQQWAIDFWTIFNRDWLHLERFE
ncbi:MAG: C1 family peptidase [Candidatus Thiodiazotropha sp.]